MPYSDYSREDLLRCVEIQHGVLEANRSRIAQLEMRLAAGGLVERAATDLCARAMAELTTPHGTVPLQFEKYVQEVAVRCWQVARIFAEAGGAALPEPPPKGGA